MRETSHLRYVSLSASGSSGIAFEGVLRALEDHLPDFALWTRSLQGVAGTSGGALMALIIALSINRYQRAHVLTFLSDVTNIIRCPNIALMLDNFGVEDGTSFRRVVQEILTLGGLSENSTMNDLHRLLRIDVIFLSHNLCDGMPVQLTATRLRISSCATQYTPPVVSPLCLRP